MGGMFRFSFVLQLFFLCVLAYFAYGFRISTSNNHIGKYCLTPRARFGFGRPSFIAQPQPFPFEFEWMVDSDTMRLVPPGRNKIRTTIHSLIKWSKLDSSGNDNDGNESSRNDGKDDKSLLYPRRRREKNLSEDGSDRHTIGQSEQSEEKRRKSHLKINRSNDNRRGNSLNTLYPRRRIQKEETVVVEGDNLVEGETRMTKISEAEGGEREKPPESSSDNTRSNVLLGKKASEPYILKQQQRHQEGFILESTQGQGQSSMGSRSARDRESFFSSSSRRQRTSEKRSLRSFHVGEVINGTVSNIQNFGLMVDIGGERPYLLHFSQMPFYMRSTWRELFSIESPIQVRVLSVNFEMRIVNLTLKDLYQNVEAVFRSGPNKRYPQTSQENFKSYGWKKSEIYNKEKKKSLELLLQKFGTNVFFNATVATVLEYGSFLQLPKLPDGTENQGLLHRNDYHAGLSKHGVEAGQNISVRIKEIDLDALRISLTTQRYKEKVSKEDDFEGLSPSVSGDMADAEWEPKRKIGRGVRKTEKEFHQQMYMSDLEFEDEEPDIPEFFSDQDIQNRESFFLKAHGMKRYRPGVDEDPEGHIWQYPSGPNVTIPNNSVATIDSSYTAKTSRSWAGVHFDYNKFFEIEEIDYLKEAKESEDSTNEGLSPETDYDVDSPDYLEKYGLNIKSLGKLKKEETPIASEIKNPFDIAPFPAIETEQSKKDFIRQLFSTGKFSSLMDGEDIIIPEAHEFEDESIGMEDDVDDAGDRVGSEGEPADIDASDTADVMLDEEFNENDVVEGNDEDKVSKIAAVSNNKVKRGSNMFQISKNATDDASITNTSSSSSESKQDFVWVSTFDRYKGDPDIKLLGQFDLTNVIRSLRLVRLPKNQWRDFYRDEKLLAQLQGLLKKRKLGKDYENAAKKKKKGGKESKSIKLHRRDKRLQSKIRALKAKLRMTPRREFKPVFDEYFLTPEGIADMTTGGEKFHELDMIDEALADDRFPVDKTFSLRPMDPTTLQTPYLSDGENAVNQNSSSDIKFLSTVGGRQGLGNNNDYYEDDIDLEYNLLHNDDDEENQAIPKSTDAMWGVSAEQDIELLKKELMIERKYEDDIGKISDEECPFVMWIRRKGLIKTEHAGY